jgi:hypothetical protein
MKGQATREPAVRARQDEGEKRVVSGTHRIIGVPIISIGYPKDAPTLAPPAGTADPDGTQPHEPLSETVLTKCEGCKQEIRVTLDHLLACVLLCETCLETVNKDRAWVTFAQTVEFEPCQALLDAARGSVAPPKDSLIPGGGPMPQRGALRAPADPQRPSPARKTAPRR